MTVVITPAEEQILRHINALAEWLGVMHAKGFELDPPERRLAERTFGMIKDYFEDRYGMDWVTDHMLCPDYF